METRKVLVVEDEKNIRDLVCLHLGIEGYECVPVADGKEAMLLAGERRFDLVILDLMLPGVDGVTITRALRRHGPNRDAPILMLTERREEADKVMGLDSGADDYLTKPFSFVVLLARLRSLVRRDSGPRPAVLEAGGLTLDPATHRVQADGADVELSPREFRLLEHLLRAAPAVVGKEELLDRVWASGDDANVVEVYVGYLRRKLGRERIETVRGVGYRVAV